MEALLYLVMLRFANRDYSTTNQLLKSCCVDFEFSTSERFCFKMIESLVDANPNGASIRTCFGLDMLFCASPRYSAQIIAGAPILCQSNGH